jgi:hypothetical protein
MVQAREQESAGAAALQTRAKCLLRSNEDTFGEPSAGPRIEASLTRGYTGSLAPPEIAIQTTTKIMITFQPDRREGDTGVPIETGLFLGVREEPALESTQLRWQVRLHPSDIVQVESDSTYLEDLGGALFLTTREPPPESPPGETGSPLGWMKWMGKNGRRSFQIHLAISRVGFDRICHLAEKSQFPDVILTFREDGPIEHGLSPDGNKKIWKDADTTVALIAEFTLRYDFAKFASARS